MWISLYPPVGHRPEKWGYVVYTVIVRQVRQKRQGHEASQSSKPQIQNRDYTYQWMDIKWTEDARFRHKIKYSHLDLT